MSKNKKLFIFYIALFSFLSFFFIFQGFARAKPVEGIKIPAVHQGFRPYRIAIGTDDPTPGCGTDSGDLWNLGPTAYYQNISINLALKDTAGDLNIWHTFLPDIGNGGIDLNSKCGSGFSFRHFFVPNNAGYCQTNPNIKNLAKITIWKCSNGTNDFRCTMAALPHPGFVVGTSDTYSSLQKSYYPWNRGTDPWKEGYLKNQNGTNSTDCRTDSVNAIKASADNSGSNGCLPQPEGQCGGEPSPFCMPGDLIQFGVKKGGTTYNSFIQYRNDYDKIWYYQCTNTLFNPKNSAYNCAAEKPSNRNCPADQPHNSMYKIFIRKDGDTGLADGKTGINSQSDLKAKELCNYTKNFRDLSSGDLDTITLGERSVAQLDSSEKQRFNFSESALGYSWKCFGINGGKDVVGSASKPVVASKLNCGRVVPQIGLSPLVVSVSYTTNPAGIPVMINMNDGRGWIGPISSSPFYYTYTAKGTDMAVQIKIPGEDQKTCAKVTVTNPKTGPSVEVAP